MRQRGENLAVLSVVVLQNRTAESHVGRHLRRSFGAKEEINKAKAGRRFRRRTRIKNGENAEGTDYERRLVASFEIFLKLS